MNISALDNPIWHAVTSRHRDIARIAGDAARYREDVSPFAAVRDDKPLDSLANLVPPRDTVVIMFGHQAPPPATRQWRTLASFDVRQMVAPRSNGAAPVRGAAIVPLAERDDEQMLALAKLTEPGPFELHTRLMGRYFGIFHDARLVAMAGERLRIPGWVEVSGVCTHPDARGRGYAAALVAHVMRQVFDDGDDAFLHVRLGSPSEQSATALYERLGFRHHQYRTLHVLQSSE